MNVVYCSVIIFYLLSIAVVLCTVLVVQHSFYSVTVKFSHTFYKCCICRVWLITMKEMLSFFSVEIWSWF